MSLDDDLRQAAVDAATNAIRPLLWTIAPHRHQEVAEAAVRAAAPFLDGTELERVKVSDSGSTVTP